MKYIYLRNAKTLALVDDEDFGRVSALSWHREYNGYVRHTAWDGQKHYAVILHRFLLGKPPAGMKIDHINRNKLDNRRCNLRFVGNSISNHNRSCRNKGVTFHKASGKWQAQRQDQNKYVYLGLFSTKKAALIAASTWKRKKGVGGE